MFKLIKIGLVASLALFMSSCNKTQTVDKLFNKGRVEDPKGDVVDSDDFYAALATSQAKFVANESLAFAFDMKTESRQEIVDEPENFQESTMEAKFQIDMAKKNLLMKISENGEYNVNGESGTYSGEMAYYITDTHNYASIIYTEDGETDDGSYCMSITAGGLFTYIQEMFLVEFEANVEMSEATVEIGEVIKKTASKEVRYYFSVVIEDDGYRDDMYAEIAFNKDGYLTEFFADEVSTGPYYSGSEYRMTSKAAGKFTYKSQSFNFDTSTFDECSIFATVDELYY